MKISMLLAFSLLVVPAWGQDEKRDAKQDEKKPEDKIGKMKAPETLKKALPEITKKKGYHVNEKVTIPALGGRGGGGQAQEPEFEGVVLKGDLAAMKGALEVYAKGPVTLVKNTKGEFVDPEKLTGQEAQQGTAFKNPALLVAEVFHFLATSAFTNDEAVEGVDCKIVETFADPKTTEDQIKRLLDRISKQIPDQGGGGGGGGGMGGMGGMLGQLSNYVDKKASSSTYKMWLGKNDLLPYKIEWTLTIVVDKAKIPGGFGAQVPDKLEAMTVLKISKYDEALEVDWPKEIRAKFGIAK